MNQILITEKVIITRDFDKRRRRYKTCFFLSIFAACTLFSYSIYAEYDRNKGEQVSQDMLASIYAEDGDTSDETMMEDIEAIQILGKGEQNQTSEETSKNTSRSNQNSLNNSVVEYVASDRNKLSHRFYT